MKNAIKWIFGLSLTANIFLVGFILGQEAPPPFPPSFQGRADASIERTVEQFAPEKKQAVLQSFQEMKVSRRATFDKIKKNREELIAILEAPTFDESQFIEKSKESDTLFLAEKQDMMRRMADMAKGFDVTERHQLAKHLRHPHSMNDGPRGQGPNHGNGRMRNMDN